MSHFHSMFSIPSARAIVCRSACVEKSVFVHTDKHTHTKGKGEREVGILVGTLSLDKQSEEATLKLVSRLSSTHSSLPEIQPWNPQEWLVGRKLTRFPVLAELVPPTPSSPLEELLVRHSQTAETVDGHVHSQTGSKYSHPPNAASAEHLQPDQHHHHHHRLDPRGTHGGGKAHLVASGRSRKEFKKVVDEWNDFSMYIPFERRHHSRIVQL